MTTMKMVRRNAPVGIAALAAVAVAVGVATAGAMAGTAQAAVDCTASGLARTVAGVTNGAADYLDAHPDVNTALTNLKGEPRAQMRADAQKYLEANPGVRADLQTLRTPLTDFGQRCGMSIPVGPLGG
jgi:heme-binding protein